jgi:transcriptional regulator with XRE-family HTH domain
MESAMADVGQTLRRRKLGKELRRHREAAGLKVRDLTSYVGLQPGTISKIENGNQAILPKNVRLMLQACGVGAPTMDTLIRLAEESDDRGWWTGYSDTIPQWFETYVDLESDAEEIWTYTSELVDGLLQTAEYAEAVARAAYPDITEDHLKRIVEVRQARQAQLDRENPANLRVVCSEAVVRRKVGGPDVMRGQILRLVELSSQPNITIQVIPFDAGAHPAMKGNFTLLRFPEGFADMDCVYLENENGEVWQERPGDIARYSDVLGRVRDQALSPEETTSFLDSLV